jgi:LmbE family N-acetylglucosaminyl deacetylase
MKNSGQWSAVSGQQKAIAQSKLRGLLALSLFMLAIIATVSGQQQQQQQRVAPTNEAENNSIELYQSLLDLQNPWTVMCIAAHPDDEDGATLTVLRRKYGVNTVTVFSTYGEGGQNAVGPELYEELGAIRARETEEAARIQGSEPFFLGLRDFGFSKSAEEAFRIWGHDEALRRMVLKIRQLRPDVIITNHDTVTGHGHHQATGRLVLEAFDAAADPQRFPEQLQRGGVSTWQVQRLFVRFSFEGSAASKAAEDEAARAGKIVSVNRNERDPVRGTTYAEQALQALRRHATQGPWPQTLPAGGVANIRYRLALNAKTAAPLPANAQTFLDGLSLPQNIQERVTPLAVKALLLLYEKQTREQILEALLRLKKAQIFAAPKGTEDEQRFVLMDERLQHALEVASGITMTVALNDEVLVPNAPATFSIVISNQSDKEVQLKPRAVILAGPKATELGDDAGIANAPTRLAPKSKITLSVKRDTPADEPINVPHAAHLYDNLLFGERFNAILKANIDGSSFFIHATTQADVAPAVEIVRITPSPLVVTEGKESPFTVVLINHRPRQFSGRVMIKGRVGAEKQLGSVFQIAPGETHTETGSFVDLGNSNANTPKPSSDLIRFSVRDDGIKGNVGQSSVTEQTVKIIYTSARVVPNLQVGYVRSFDETLRHALAALGVEAKELTVDDVRTNDLNKYQAIIIDNRGYQAHPELIAADARLLDYARAGGTLIVFYHKTNEWNPDTRAARPQLAPYPITLGNSRVTDENAPIEFTESEHPLLNYPNKITQQDFTGWIQERGLYYPESWDSHYSAPFATSDRGEPTLRGGLLAADYGRGRYIYTSMVWYRQLRAGVPGAYRMLANMISYGRQEK